MQIEASVIEIYRTDNSSFIICNTALCVDKTGGIFVYLHSRSYQLRIVVPSYHVNIPFVRNMRSYYSYIHPLLCGKNERIFHFLVEDKVRSCYINILSCVIYQLHVSKLTDGFVIQRRIRERLDIAVKGYICKAANIGEVLLTVVTRTTAYIPKL